MSAASPACTTAATSIGHPTKLAADAGTAGETEIAYAQLTTACPGKEGHRYALRTLYFQLRTILLHATFEDPFYGAANASVQIKNYAANSSATRRA